MARVSAKLDKNSDLVRFGAVVRAHRLALGLSQEALADQAEIDRSHMGKLERGERNLSFLNILRIVNLLNRDNELWNSRRICRWLGNTVSRIGDFYYVCDLIPYRKCGVVQTRVALRDPASAVERYCCPII